MSQLKYLLPIYCALFTLFSDMAIASAQTPIPEYTLKAGYLYNFALLTQWPETDSDENFNLCYSGTDDIQGHLSSIQGKQVSKKLISIKKLHTIEQAKECHLLFISKTSSFNTGVLLNTIKSLPILTVTDETVPTYQDMAITLRPEGKRLAFEINTDAAKRANLTIRARLLRLSR